MSKPFYRTFMGKMKWAKVIGEPETFMGNTFWSLQFYPDDVAAIRAIGIKNNIREDEDGTYLKIKRPAEKLFTNRDTGRKELTYFTPPFIYGKTRNDVLLKYTDKEGLDLRAYKGDQEVVKVGDLKAIGNGSYGGVNMIFYDAGMYGMGGRLENIQVHDLVAYDPDEQANNGDAFDEQNDKPDEAAKEEAPW